MMINLAKEYQNWISDGRDSIPLERHLWLDCGSNLCFNKYPIFYNLTYDSFSIVINNVIYSMSDWPGDQQNAFNNCMKNLLSDSVKYKFDGILIKNKTKNLSNYKNIILRDADDNFGMSDDSKNLMPLISFGCVHKMFPKIKNISNYIANVLKLLDFETEQVISLTKSELNTCQNFENFDKQNRGLKPPKLGFSLINRMGCVWHKSGGVLLSDANGTRYLFGQDEGTYFGVELQHKVNTIKDAFNDLIPLSLRKRKNISRQGEWFAVPVDKKEVPEMNQCLVVGKENCAIDLPVRSNKDNRHTVAGSDFRISTFGSYFLNPQLEHDEHATLRLKGWYRFERNTAVRSVSQEGVD